MRQKKRGLPKIRNPFVTPMLARTGSSASGRHHTHVRDVAKGRRRHPKHRMREEE